ncbi:MAG: hypothetical protein JWQ97_4183 [Phenylobacterium sp.]|nr:hypothetical protein [Phenylobacterium sp.]
MTTGLKLISIATAVAMLAAGAANANDRPSRRDNCFLSNAWTGWSATHDGDALYLRITQREVYRAELTPGSHVRKFGDEFLVSRVRGSNWICSPLDLDLTLADRHGMRQPLIVRSLHRLTTAEIAAIPRKEVP